MKRAGCTGNIGYRAWGLLGYSTSCRPSSLLTWKSWKPSSEAEPPLHSYEPAPSRLSGFWLAGALPVSLAAPHQRARPRGAAAAGRRRTGRGPALLARLWPVPCRLYPLLWPQRPVRFGCMRTHANDFQPVVATVAAVASAKASGRASRGVLLLEVRALPAGLALGWSRSRACLLALKAGAAALPVGLATPHQCARPRGAAAARRAAAGERRAGRGRVPAFWR